MTIEYKIVLNTGQYATTTPTSNEYKMSKRQAKTRLAQYGIGNIKHIEQIIGGTKREISVDEFVRQNDKKNI